MKTGFRGTFVLSWTQTEIDGLSGAPTSALAVGATWQWQGKPVRVDGPADVLVLGQSDEAQQLRRHVARTARRLAGVAMAPEPLEEPDEPVLDSGFAVTDGLRRYTATLIERSGKPPLCMFLDQLPPRGQELWVTHVTSGTTHPHRTGDAAPSVICFTPDTMIATPAGATRIAELAEGDRVLTRDDGPQTIRWIGHRRMSGARLFAMPELRPVRIRAGALGIDRPDAELVVSPQHRMLVRGAVAQSLFGSDEVLVAARDLVNDRSVIVDRALREVTYVHLLLDRHSIVFANGLESESFHPATADLDAMETAQLRALAERVPGVDRDVGLYGPFARRMLSRSEAEILRFAATRAH